MRANRRIQTESREKGVSIKKLLEERGILVHQYFWWKREYSKQEVAAGFLPVASTMPPAVMSMASGAGNTHGKSKADPAGENGMSIKLRTVTGTDMCIQGAPEGYNWKDNGDGTNTLTANVAQIGSSYYATLAEAVAASKDGDTIVLLNDCDVTSTINVNHSLTLDLNGKIVTNKTNLTRAFFVNAESSIFTIEGNNGKMVTPEECDNYGFVDLKEAAALVVKNTTFEGATHNGSFIRTRKRAEVTLTNVNATTMLGGSQEAATANFNSLGVNSIVVFGDFGVLNVTGGTYNHNSWKAENNGAPIGFAFDAENAVASFKDVTINSNVGTIVSAYASDFENCSLTGAETAGASWAATAIALAHSVYGTESYSSLGELNRKDNNIKSGTYSGRYAVAIWSTGSQLNISGGTFIGSEASVAVIGDNGNDADTFEVNISGGSFTGPIYISGNNRAQITITGGTFDFDPSAYVAAGYEAVKYGNNWNVQKLLDVAQIGSTKYATLKAAFDAAGSGDTIELLQDVDLANTNWIPVGTSTAPFTSNFDGKGHKIKGLTISSGSYVGLFGYVSGGATIKNVTLENVSISGVKRVAALIGQIKGNAAVENCIVSSGSVTGSDSNTGGIIGEIVTGTVTLSNLKNYADVTNTEASDSRAGGIVGQVTTNANVTLTGCVNNGTITTNSGYAGGIVSAYQSGTLNIVDCVNNGTLTGQYKGNMLGWYTSVKSISISTTSNVFDINAIGCVDIAISSNMSLYGKNYFVNKTAVLAGVSQNKQTFSSIFAEGEIGTSPKALWDKLIAFYSHAAETNNAFASYPKTYWEMFDISVIGYSSPDWNEYLNSYNASVKESSQQLTKEEFSSASWRQKIVYLAPEE